MKRINLDQMKNMSIDNLIELYRDGYRLEEHTPITSLSNLPNFSNIHTLQEPLLDPVTNFGKVIVSSCTGGCTATATEVVVDDGTKFPDPTTRAFNLIWWNSTDYADPSDDPNKEIVRCTAKSGNVLTITRTQEGTSASTKSSSGKVYKMILSVTKKTMSDISSAITTRVVKSGDTMTGTLNLPTNGLIVGTNQLIVSGGNVGIGATSPETKLYVQGGYGSPLDDGSYLNYLVSRFKNTGSGNQAYVEIRSVSTGNCGLLLKPSTAAGTSGWGFITSNSGDLRIAFGSGITDLKDGVGGINILASNNYVGIGTTYPTAKLHISGTSGVDGIKFPDGTLQTTAATSIPVGSYSPQINTTSTSYVKLLNFKFISAFTGNITMSWEMSRDTANQCYAKIYKNGVAIGTEKSLTATTTWEIKSDTVSVTMAVNDVLELWGYRVTNSTLSVRNILLGNMVLAYL